MTPEQHGLRVALLMGAVAVLLAWLASRTEVLFADGLRYIAQAGRIEAGSLADGLLRSVDHPAYPLAIAAVHRELGGDGPASWQRAGQAASILAGVLLVVPLYLVALELFGGRSAWLSVVLTYAVPLTGHVLADVLSEGLFLLFWSWGLWCTLRFLKEGWFAWLPPAIGFGALAYLTRPEGLLLPGALVATLMLMPLVRSSRLNWPRWWAAVGLLVIGPGLLIGPYVMAKGGLGTKPAIQRLLGTAPRSAADAVERQRPLDPNQSTAMTYALSFKSTFEAVRDAVTPPLLPLAVVGLVACGWPFSDKARVWLLVGVIDAAGVLALVRLHATGGYCTPRHALILALMIFPAAAAGLDLMLRSIVIPGRWLGLGEERFRPGPAAWVGALALLLAWNGREIAAPLNVRFGGYREAASFVAGRTDPDEPIVDVTGWAEFYGDRPGYTFANLVEAPADPRWRFVVVRQAHLDGPWWYSARLRDLVSGLEPLATFPAERDTRKSRVLVFERPARTAQAPPPAGRH